MARKSSDISGSVASLVNPVSKHAFEDGHDVNESYKQPMPKLPLTKVGTSSNSSYMHPHGSSSSLEKPWQSVDKTLNEAARHPEQLSRSKTVFPVNTEKVRGAPKQPAFKSGQMKPPSPTLR